MLTIISIESSLSSGWLLPIAEGEQRFKFFSSFYTYRSCWVWLIAQNGIAQKKWKWTNAKRRNDIDTVGVRAGCVLTAFEDSSFNGDQVVYLALHLHHPRNKQEAIVQKLHFSNLTFAPRSPSELILVIGEKHRLWFWTVWSRSGLDSVHVTNPPVADGWSLHRPQAMSTCTKKSNRSSASVERYNSPPQVEQVTQQLSVLREIHFYKLYISISCDMSQLSHTALVTHAIAWCPHLILMVLEKFFFKLLAVTLSIWWGAQLSNPWYVLQP